MRDRKYTVYIHTNKINNKVYVGITVQEPNRRWKNGKGYKRNKHFYSAIQKYGWESFEHKILFSNISEHMAKQYEIYLIKCYDSTNREKGYNRSKGGEGAYGIILSEEAKEKIRKVNLGKKVVYTKEGLKSKREKFKGGNNPRARQVVCDGIIYGSITEMMKSCNLQRGDISGWLSGRKTMPQEWYDRGLRYVDSSLGTPIRREYHLVRKQAKQVEVDNLIFDSIVLCAKYLDINDSTLRYYLDGKRTMPKHLKDRGLKYKRMVGE